MMIFHDYNTTQFSYGFSLASVETDLYDREREHFHFFSGKTKEKINSSSNHQTPSLGDIVNQEKK